jgi:TRAP-type uncharacterized transport system fused permease subunit
MGSFKNLAGASAVNILVVCLTAMFGIAALAAGMQGWAFRKTTGLERWLLIIAGLFLVYPRAAFDYIGLALLIAVIAVQNLRRAEPHPVPG